MRATPLLTALGLLVAAAMVSRAIGIADHLAVPSVALLTFAVAAFSGPVR